MNLIGPDGKELSKPAPQKGPMMDRQQKFNMIFMVFTIMTKEERQKLIKMLKPLRRKLDLMYPNGMTEEDIKRDIEKAAVQVVPNEANNAVAEKPEVQPEPSVPAQPESDQSVTESAESGLRTFEQEEDDAKGF